MKYLVIYNWKIHNDRKSLFICVKKNNCFIIEDDITPDGNNYYGGQGNRFVGHKINDFSEYIVAVEKYNEIKWELDEDNYLRRIGL